MLAHLSLLQIIIIKTFWNTELNIADTGFTFADTELNQVDILISSPAFHHSLTYQYRMDQNNKDI